MERWAALELLALDPDEPLTHDRLRRVYLRRLRDFPPERDPEGFRRLREAFELLEPLARSQEAAPIVARPPRRPARPAVEHPARRSAPRLALVPAPAEASERAADRSSAPHADIDAPDPAADRDTAPIASVDALPAAFDAPDAETPEPETAPLLWRGPPEAVPALVDAEPPEPEPPEPEPPEPEPPEPETDPLLRWAPPSHPPRIVFEAQPSLREVTSDILARFERGELDRALNLADRWHHSSADDHRAVSPADAARWALTRELVEIAPALTTGLRRAIARGIATDDLASASSAVEAFGAIDPKRAADLDRHAAKRAESLHKAIWRPLHAKQAQFDPILPPPPQKRRGTPLWLVAVLLLSALLRAGASCPDRSTRERYEPIQLPAGTRWPELNRDRPRFELGPPRLAPDPPRFERDPPRHDRELPRLEPDPAPPAMPGDPPPRTQP